MKKALLILTLAVGLFSCSKSEDPAPEQKQMPQLTGTIWYGPGEKSGANGMTYYDHLHFTSPTDVDVYSSYQIGEQTDIYTGHLKYTITQPDIINVKGTDGFGKAVNDTYQYKNGTLIYGTDVFNKFK